MSTEYLVQQLAGCLVLEVKVQQSCNAELVAYPLMNIVRNRKMDRGELRRGKLNSQFIVTARIDLSIFTKNFKVQSLLLLSLQ